MGRPPRTHGATVTVAPWVFTARVAVTDATGAHHVFDPGDLVPDWARPLVGAHVVAPDPNAVPDAPIITGPPVTLRTHSN